MNSGATAERVYDAIKQLLPGHRYRPGERIDPAALADELFSSVTPIRDALNRLIGEGLVETRAGGGFHQPAIDAPALQDLYDWNASVLLVALRAWPDVPVGAASPHPADAASLFAAIGSRSRNAEHPRAIAGLNDRLKAVRSVEPGVLGDPLVELAALVAALEASEPRTLRRLVQAYHRRRWRAAAEIVRALHRAPIIAQ